MQPNACSLSYFISFSSDDRTRPRTRRGHSLQSSRIRAILPFFSASTPPPLFSAFNISFSRDFFPRACTCTPEERCGETGCELLSEETFRYIHHQRRGGQCMEHSTTPTIHGPGSNAKGPGGGFVMPRTKVESRKSKVGLKPSRHRSIPKANQENSETE